MARHVFAPPVELAIATGLPELLALLMDALPPALSVPVGDYSPQLREGAEEWTRKLLARVLTPPVHVDASATGAPLGIVDNG